MAQEGLFEYTLTLADNALVLGHRLSQWCGVAPLLEEDLGLANLALDLIGQARSLYEYAARVEGKGRSEDDLAYVRLEREYKNVLLVEQPNGDFAHTMVRHLYYVALAYPFMLELSKSKDETLAAIAAKAEKELAYHLRHVCRWVVRLGDGTPESHKRTQDAVDGLWMYTGELFETTACDDALIESGVAVDVNALKPTWLQTLQDVFAEATLSMPQKGWMQSGGKRGVHSEHMGFLLADLQYMQRVYPNCAW